MKKFIKNLIWLSFAIFILGFSNAVSDNNPLQILGMGNVNCIAISPDDSKIVSAGGLGLIYVWDVQISKVVDTVKIYGKILSLAISPDGSLIAAGNAQGEIYIVDFKSGKTNSVLFDTDHWSYVSTLKFSPDGYILFSGCDDGAIKLWDIKSEQLLKTFEGYSYNARTFAVSSDGKKLASIVNEYTNSIKLWDIDSESLILDFSLKSTSFRSVDFSPDGTKLMGCDGKIKLWDASTGLILDSIEIEDNFCHKALFSKDGKRIISCWQDSSIRIFNVQTGAVLKNFIAQPVMSMQLNNSSKMILCRYYDNSIKMFDIEIGIVTKTFVGHTEGFNSLTFSNDGKRLACTNQYRFIDIWNTETGELINEFSNGTFYNEFALNPNGNQIAFAIKDTIFLHDITTRLLVKKYITNSGKILTLAFNSEGTILASSSLDSILKIWDVVLGTELKSYSLKTETPLYSISFAKGDTILKCFSNYHVYLFNINSGTLKSIHEIERSNPAIFNPDLSVLAVSHYWDISFYKVENDSLEKTASGNLSIYCLAFTPNGKVLACGGRYGGYFGDGQRIQVWHAASGALVDEYFGHYDYVNSITFSPDGTKFASAGGDGTIMIWRSNFPNSIEDELKISNNLFSISPNPASDFIEIYHPPLEKGSGGVDIKIYDLFGQNVSTPVCFADTPASVGQRIDVSALAPGMYFVRIGDRVSKFIKL